MPAYPGARCFGNSLPLKSNLPLGTSTDATDVVDTNVIRDRSGTSILGWYYFTREGRRFVQPAKRAGTRLADLFSAAGIAPVARGLRDDDGQGFFPLDAREARVFETFARERGVLGRCFTRPLGAANG